MSTSFHLPRRAFIGALAGTALAPGQLLNVQALGAVDVRRFGAAGDGVRNDTAAFAAALRAAASVYVPAGVYLADRILVPAGRTILTDGFATVFRQRPGTPAGTRLLNVIGSNVRIGDCRVVGNIGSDSGEQHHGIFVEARGETGDLTNIAIGQVQGANIRGDVVYVGTRDGRSARDVRVGWVHGDNVLRNLVSVVGGQRIRIDRVTGSRVGYTHLDIEPDDYNGPVIGCSVGAVHGGFVQIAGQTSRAFVDQVGVGVMELISPVPRSVPTYPPGLSRLDAVTLRNVRSLDIGRFTARGFGGQAIRQVWDPGALTDQQIHIGEASISDCCKDDGVPEAYILGNKRATRLSIDRLEVDLWRSGIDAVRDCKAVSIGEVRGIIPPGSKLIGKSLSEPDALPYVAGGSAVAYAAYRLARHAGR